MRLSDFKNSLVKKERIAFELPNGKLVPRHFHVTEVGQVDKRFIDCGGTLRNEKVINFQLWEAEDYDHRLHPEKLVSIIELSEEKLDLEDLEIEVEYQGDTIGKYGLEENGDIYRLTSLTTDCLAKDKCGVEVPKKKVSLADLGKQKDSSCCTPDSGCC